MENNTKDIPELQIAKWADYNHDGDLMINSAQREIQMCNSDGTGSPLFSFNGFGADVIRFAASKGVGNHVHEGDHILFVLKGFGFVEYNGVDHPLYPGLSYLIPGEVNHAIKANDDLVLIAVGNNHRPLDSQERMTPIDK